MRLLDQRQKSLIGHDFATVNNYHHTLTITRVAVQLLIHMYLCTFQYMYLCTYQYLYLCTYQYMYLSTYQISIPVFLHLWKPVFGYLSIPVFLQYQYLYFPLLWKLTFRSHSVFPSERRPCNINIIMGLQLSEKKILPRRFFFFIKSSQGKYIQPKYHIDNLFF